MEESRNKIVEFAYYCKLCKYQETESVDEPCNECLSYPTNIDSHKPVKWEEK